MPNLVGIGNSQVPTNAMLGGLAYQDPAHANLTNVEIENIAAIKANTSDTAVDIFVYDTRKDSDGGAWRKRTKDTSWYNEGLGPHRGHRKEFPAVAVIVASSSALTIYDADDPNCSMWMIFVNDNAKWLKHTTSGPKSVVAMNGIVVSCGAGGAGRLSAVNFVSDDGYVTESGYTYRHDWISTRNSTAVGPTDGGTRSIVNNSCHAVAITVLPNAPIDDVTGLPIPTIIVGTEGGVSVLKDDGKVFDLSGFSPVTFVAIEGEDLVAALGGTTTHDFIFKTNLPSIDEAFDAQITAGSGNYYMNSNSGTTPLLRDLNMTAMSYNPSDGTVYRGGDNGFDIITKPRTVSGTSNISLISYIDTDYNSGYMVGDIKGAWLSSTDDTDISADTLQDESHSTLDSTFSTTTGWSGHGGGSDDWTIDTSAGKAECDGQNNQRFLYPNANTFAIGTIVIVEVTVTDYTSGTLDISYSTGGITAGTSMTATGTYYHIGEVTGNQIVYLRSNSFIGKVDNVKMYIAEADRSKNNKGIAVAGTITKTKVATGSDLVYYSGSSATNFLRQPYNADLNFGTGDFSIFVWAKVNTINTNHYIVDRATTQPSWGSNTGRAYFVINASGYHRYKLSGGAEVSGSVRTVPAGVFNHIGFVRVGGDMQLWLNGELVETITGSNASASFDDGVTTQTTTINRYANGFAQNYTFDAMALLRISGSAPSAEQIIKMYDDEKLLFTPNAKCTLSGATSAVKALGFDDTNNTLHVGTLSGRSDFCGLNRINNTTTAVTTAISASNGVVAEQ